MPDDAPPLPLEKVQGLDPRALLARGLERPDTSAILRVWKPPTVAELGALLPQFEVLALVGRGGMGAVYQARQPALGRAVAIKLLPAEAAADAAFAQRFSLEIRVLAKLQHPNIVAIYDSGQTAAGHLYCVMEYIDGADLAQQVASGPLPLDRAIEIVLSVCAALQFAHERGVIHRDVKPANILVARDGGVKVTDFGLARLRGEAESPGSRLTQSGTVVGTLDYMAPEQHAGRELDARADLYSVGVMFYELLTGQVPRGAWLLPSQKAKIDPRFDAIVLRALHPEPAQRFASASDFAAALLRPAPVSRRRAIVKVAGGAVLLGVGAWWWKSRPPAGPAPASLLTDLDLETAIVAGDWRWLANHRGGTLDLPLQAASPAKLLRLPARPGLAAYDFLFHLCLTAERSTAGVLLKTGATRVGVLFNYAGSCGIALIRGRFWNENETTITRLLPVGEWQSIEIAVRPDAAIVSVVVRVAGQPWMRWSGIQSDLSVYEESADGWALGDQESLAFASAAGGLLIRDVEWRLLG